MQVLKEDIRGRILAVAKLQFGQKGYSKTSMREIAELAGVGVGNIYNYFTGKDELFGEVVRPVMHALEAMLQEHHGIRGEDVMRMKSEKYLKACIDEYVSLLSWNKRKYDDFYQDWYYDKFDNRHKLNLSLGMRLTRR